MSENKTKYKKKKSYLKSVLRCIIILVLLLLQFAIVFALAYYLNSFAVYVYFIIEVLSILIMFPLISEERNAAYKIYWIGIILLLPLVGHIMYEFWGREKVNRKSHKLIQQCIDEMNTHQYVNPDLIRSLRQKDAYQAKVAEYLTECGYPLYGNTKVTYFNIGEKAFKDMETELQKAKRFICISFFTIADGVIWDKICEILIQKVREGVRVQVMYDDAGSVFQLSDSTVEKLKGSGIQVLRFNPVERSYHRLFLNYRNHQKIVIIDGSISYTGGINASDRYANIDSPYGHWKDVAIKMEGDAVRSMSMIFLGMWAASGRKENWEDYLPNRVFPTGELCQPFADGPSNNPSNEAMDMFLQVINSSTETVNIMTPYLIIDDNMRDTLCLTAKSGIKVTIITPGIPDKKYTKRLTEWHYGSLLKAGVRIYEYVPGFVHAKLCCNEKSAIVGTINMDFRSFFIHFENGVWLPEGKVLEEIKEDFAATLLLSKEVTYEEWKNRPLIVKVMQNIAVWMKCQF